MNTQRQNKPTQGLKNIWVIGAIFLAIVLIIGGVVYFFQRKIPASMLITGNTGEKYCRNNNDCKIETGCGCADGNKECQKGDDVWKTLNDFHPNCYCINH